MEKLIAELIDLHRSHVEVWRHRNKDIDKLVHGLANHLKQRQLFERVDVTACQLVQQCPNIKRQLMQKLDLKIHAYALALGEHRDLMDQQKRRICAHTDKCKAAAQSHDLEKIFQWKQAQVSSAYFLEFCFKLDQLYISKHLVMLKYLHSNSTSGEFFSVSAFEQILSDYLL